MKIPLKKRKKKTAMNNDKCWLYKHCNHRDCNASLCIRKYKLDYLYEQSNLSLSQREPIKLRLECDTDSNGNPLPQTGVDYKAFMALKDVEQDIEHFVSDGCNMLIRSKTCGNGKTSWAIKLMQAYFNKIWTKSSLSCQAMYINVPRFLLELKSNISEKSDYITHIKEEVLDCPLVVWDELGTKDLTTFEHENVLSLVNARIDRSKSNIYTTNLNKNELKEAIGDRLYSRIVNMSYDIELFGRDMRGVTNNY